jgi:hypothetical protein
MTMPFGPEMRAAMAEAQGEANEQQETGLILDTAPSSEQAADMGRRKRAVESLYGSQCPLIMDDPDDSDWTSWAQSLWDSRTEYMQPILHRAERLRMMRAGNHWVSSRNNGPWREPPKPKDAVRRVVNVMGEAMDWRLQVLSEQRPGPRAKPRTMDPDDVRRATAANLVLEYAYHAQRYQAALKEGGFWAQTDGVAFLRTFWDTDRGAFDPEMQMPLGDPACRIYRIEQVRVSPNATALEAPLWWVLKEVMPKGEAVAMYGSRVADEGINFGSDGIGLSSIGTRGTTMDEHLYTTESAEARGTDVVDRFTVFLKPNSLFLPEGLELVVVGQKVVSVGPIPIGMVPMARIADGSTDPNFFPVPAADRWIDDQMALNAIESKLIENIRRNSGGKLLAKRQALVTETTRGGNDSVIEVQAPGSLSDVIQPLQGFSIGTDVKEARAAILKRLEDATGYNDTARGGMSANASGRAILAVREQLERVFAPAIFAAADMSREWAKQTLAWTRWGYDVPRMISSLGRDRPDLGREISGNDVDPDVEIELEAETMFPVPRSVRRYELDNQLQMGVIDIAEYRRRLSYADTGNMQTPDAVQEARAMRVCDAIRTGAPVPPMLWQDDEAIHQDVLERELILSAGVPDDQLQVASQRWDELAQQQAMKMGGMPPGSPGGAPGDDVGAGEAMSPLSAPTVALPGNPLPAEPMLQNQTTQSLAANLFEQTAQQ